MLHEVNVLKTKLWSGIYSYGTDFDEVYSCPYQPCLDIRIKWDVFKTPPQVQTAHQLK